MYPPSSYKETEKWMKHVGGNKLYKNLKKKFWLKNMKKEVAEFVSRCLVVRKLNFDTRNHGITITIGSTNINVGSSFKKIWRMTQ